MAFLRRPWQRIVFTAAVSGSLSAISVLLGIPLDKKEISALFMRTVCTIAGEYQQKCLAWSLMLSFAAFILGFILLFRDMRKMRRLWRIPGWGAGIILYVIAYATAQAAILHYLG